MDLFPNILSFSTYLHTQPIEPSYKQSQYLYSRPVSQREHSTQKNTSCPYQNTDCCQLTLSYLKMFVPFYYRNVYCPHSSTWQYCGSSRWLSAKTKSARIRVSE